MAHGHEDGSGLYLKLAAGSGAATEHKFLGRFMELAEEILGWKVLAFGGDGFLQRDCDDAPLLAVPRELSSPTKSARWPDSGWLVAACARNPEHEPPVESKTAAVVHQLQQGRLGAASSVGQRHDDRASRRYTGHCAARSI